MGVLEEREEQLVSEVGIFSFSCKNFSGNLLDKNDETNGSQVEAEGAARRKAEARAVEAEGRAQVQQEPPDPSFHLQDACLSKIFF